jgi:hypothetical protein
MNFSLKKIVLVIFTAILLHNSPIISMQQQQIPTKTLVKELIKGLGICIITNYFITYVNSGIEPANEYLNKQLFPGAHYILPCTLVIGSYFLQNWVDLKERLSQIQIKTRESGLLGRVKSFCSSATNLFVKNVIFKILNSFGLIASELQYIGGTIATTCNTLVPTSPMICSYVGDKTALLLFFIICSIAEHFIVNDNTCTNPLRIRAQIQPRIPKILISPEKSIIPCGTELNGAQILWFLIKNGFDIEKEWNIGLKKYREELAIDKQRTNCKPYRLSFKGLAFGNEKEEKKFPEIMFGSSKNGAHFRDFTLPKLSKMIRATFLRAEKKLQKIFPNSPVELLKSLMPFRTYPQKFQINKNQQYKENPSFIKNCNSSCDIFFGIEEAILSYLKKENLETRYAKGDQSVFLMPFTPVFIQKNNDLKTFTIYAYPDSRQDLLYPEQWEQEIKVPKWVAWAQEAIPYGLMGYSLFSQSPSYLFMPDGTIASIDNKNNLFLLNNGKIESYSNEIICTNFKKCLFVVQQIIGSTKQWPNATKKEIIDLVAALQYFNSANEQSKVTGDILSATKKEYKKISLKLHPDKNNANTNYPEMNSAIVTINEFIKKFINKHKE